MLRNILLGAGVFAALLAVLIFSGKIPVGNKGSQATGEVTMWGTIPAESMNGILQQFNPKAKEYRVNYREIPEAQFNKALVEALANGNGPDLVIAPYQYVLANAARIYPFPAASMSEKTFKDTYVDAASVLMTPQGALGLPVSVDPMVLFYNRYLLSKHGIINPPAFWDDLVRLVPTLTVKDQSGQFAESAIALGASNVPHMKDIMMTVVSQLGQVPVLRQSGQDGSASVIVTANTPIEANQNIQPLSTAALFFTGFADPRKDTYTWPQYGEQADNQFVAERLAMYIGYASELPVLRSRNPKGDFEMTYLPQTKGYNTFAVGAQMYSVATLKTSKNLITALTVESQLAGSGVAPAIAAALGATPPFRSYATVQGVPDVIARSMLVTKLWYDSFPAESVGLVASMLADIISGRFNPTDAANTFVSRLQDLYTPI